MAFGEDADVEAALDNLDRLADCLAARVAIDDNVTAALHRVANDRNFEQFLFGDEARLARQERGGREDIEKALVVGNEDVRLEAGEILEAFNFHLDAADADDAAAPRARDHSDRVRL